MLEILTIPVVLTGLGFVYGAIIGSFLNVVIFRLPRMMGVVSGEQHRFNANGLIYPESQCFHCGTPIRWWNNVPISSYLMLGARALCCGARIPIRYLVIELATATATAGLAYHYGASVETLLLCALTYLLLSAAAIDQEHFILPDKLLFPAIGLGWLHAYFLADRSLVSALIGSAVGYASFRAIALAYRWIRGREGLGLGDAKLMAVAGAWLGWVDLPFVAALGTSAGLALVTPAILSRRLTGSSEIPFGPPLTAAIWSLVVFPWPGTQLF